MQNLETFCQQTGTAMKEISLKPFCDQAAKAATNPSAEDFTTARDDTDDTHNL